MKIWFEEWFDSPEYLKVYSHRNDSEADAFISMLTQRISLSPGAKILDMACGAGRHAIALAKSGFSVCGTDLSPFLLKNAVENASAAGVEVEFLRQDIRSLNLNSTFDAALNLFTSFGYFLTNEENFGIFSTAYNILNPDGYFIFDFLNETFVRKSLSPFSRKLHPDCYIEQFRTIDNDRVNKEIIVQSGGALKRFSESVRLYSSTILQKEIEKRGFVVTEALGDYQGRQFVKDFSPRFIAICRK